MIKICEYCGKEFEEKRKGQKFCSRECASKYQSRKITTTCECCGKEFQIKRSEYNKNKHHYCSTECFNNAGREEKECEYCGKTFISKKSDHRRFCSHECAMKVIPYEQKTNREIVKCKQCGKEFEAHVSAERIFCSHECAYQWRKENGFYSEYNETMKNMGKNNFFNSVKNREDIEIMSDYINAKIKILCRCKEHGTFFEMSPWHIMEGKTGCPKCKKSRGELEIAKFLDQHKIKYITQMKFDDCRNIKPLPFDFYLVDFNKLIEYDGEQHFKPVRFGGITYEQAEKQFKMVQAHDKIKNDYAANNRIDLLRIPYTQNDNMENILLNFIYQ